ncbi:MAG TPA: phosphoglucosamine mutase [Abditibacteriaceae bacterium]|nr:phosphoglucosamine mutase [Abditibacteriaceae bacterium]
MSHGSALMIGVSGIRGVVGPALTPGIALEFVQAYAAWLKSQGTTTPLVLLARDTRPSGEMMRHAVLAGLVGSGCRVIDLGIVATPTLQLAIPHHQADGAVCVTASHNPIEWNALKFFQPNGMYLDKPMGARVLDFYTVKDFTTESWEQMGAVTFDETATQRHIARVLALVDSEAIKAKRFKVVLDGCCGAGSVISPAVLEALGCSVIPINCDLSGIFPHNPEPVNENLGQLCEAVRAHGADIGFAHDADADRVAVVTNEGEPIGEDYSLVWAVAHVLKNRRRGPVVTNLSTTMAVEAVARQFDCPTHRSPVGDVNVSGKMKEVSAVIGGEGNGGVIIPDIQFGRDGIAGLALMLEFLAQSSMTSADLGRSLPRFQIVKRTVDFPKEKMSTLLAWLKSKEKTARLDERDGMKFEWPREGETTSWAHIRPSGTEPFVRLICEAQTPAEANRIADTMGKEIASFADAI